MPLVIKTRQKSLAREKRLGISALMKNLPLPDIF